MKIGLTYSVRPSRNAGHPPTPTSITDPDSGRLELPLDDRWEEFDSPETIAALAEALSSLGHEVELLGDGVPLVQRLLSGPRPDLVWNLSEGFGGGRTREARVPALLEMFDIPHTGADPLTLAATLDKDCAERLVAQAGIPTPNWELFSGDWGDLQLRLDRLQFPVFVKPAYEGSSKGILSSSILHDRARLKPALEQLFEVYGQPVLIEEYIEGDELTVGIVGNAPPEVLGVMRVLPLQASIEPFVYSLEVKRDWRRRVRYECPPSLADRELRAVETAAVACWKALGCRDVARVDFRFRSGIPYFLEANPLPGMAPESGDLVLLSGFMGIGYVALVARVLNAAIERLNLAGYKSHVG